MTPTNNKNHGRQDKQKARSSDEPGSNKEGSNRRAFHLPAQPRSPAVHSHGLSHPARSPSTFIDDIDFPEDFYDEFVPKRTTDVPDVQEFLEPNNYISEPTPVDNKPWVSNKGHSGRKQPVVNNDERRRAPSRNFETTLAPLYPNGFQPTQTPFRPIQRPVGVGLEEERSTTAGPPQKMQAKFTLSDARRTNPLEHQHQQQRQGEKRDENDQALFYPVIKPGGSQGYQLQKERAPAVVRPFKKLKVTRPIKNQPMRHSNNDWAPEYSSESPTERAVTSKEDSPEDPGFFENENKPPRRHFQHGGHGRRPVFGSGRHAGKINSLYCTVLVKQILK
jgi:hypothetical protein